MLTGFHRPIPGFLARRVAVIKRGGDMARSKVSRAGSAGCGPMRKGHRPLSVLSGVLGGVSFDS